MHAFLSMGDTNAIEVLEKFSNDWKYFDFFLLYLYKYIINIVNVEEN